MVAASGLCGRESSLGIVADGARCWTSKFVVPSLCERWAADGRRLYRRVVGLAQRGLAERARLDNPAIRSQRLTCTDN